MSTMARLEADRLVLAADVAGRLMANIASVVHGKDDEIRLVVAALACEGHVLFEDVPGTAKTVLARAIAGSIEGVQFARIQCTPDLQPTDVTGLAIFDQKQRDFEFRPGPVFAHVLLVDEINRAMPKTQSALLEAMAEGQVTVDGETRRLPEPFILLATENPRPSSTASSCARHSATRGRTTSSRSSGIRSRATL
jgi:MoxR-like ATPase